jgi:hypothetical protein
MLYRYGDEMKEGKYLYPFSMESSENIPGSFESSTCDARIRYKLVAYFANFNDGKKRYRYETPLIVREPFRQDVTEYEGRAESEPKTYFCFRQGTVVMEARFMSNRWLTQGMSALRGRRSISS